MASATECRSWKGECWLWFRSSDRRRGVSSTSSARYSVRCVGGVEGREVLIARAKVDGTLVFILLDICRGGVVGESVLDGYRAFSRGV